MNGPGPGCVGCGEIMRPRKNSTFVLETMGDDRKPYRIWAADLWECPTCAHQITVGYSEQPIAEHYNVEAFEKFVGNVDVTLDGQLKMLPDRKAEVRGIMAQFDKLVSDLDRIVKEAHRDK